MVYIQQLARVSIEEYRNHITGPAAGNSINLTRYSSVSWRPAEDAKQNDIGFLTRSNLFEIKEILLNQFILQLNTQYKTLGFKNEAILEIGMDIIRCCIDCNKLNLIISKTGDNELLFYRQINGDYSNILIDEDADMEYMFIPTDRSKSFNEYYPFNLPFQIQDLVQKL